MSGPDPKQNKTRKFAGKAKKKIPILLIGDNKKFNVIPGSEDSNSILDKVVITDPEKRAKGGRVGLKAGSKGCKLAMKGKGRAYGKNS